MPKKCALKDKKLTLKQYVCEDVPKELLDLEEKKEKERHTRKGLQEKYDVQSSKILKLKNEIKQVALKNEKLQLFRREKMEEYKLVAKGNESLNGITRGDSKSDGHTCEYGDLQAQCKFCVIAVCIITATIYILYDIAVMTIAVNRNIVQNTNQNENRSIAQHKNDTRNESETEINDKPTADFGTLVFPTYPQLTSRDVMFNTKEKRKQKLTKEEKTPIEKFRELDEEIKKFDLELIQLELENRAENRDQTRERKK
jgi:hypothetical protein